MELLLEEGSIAKYIKRLKPTHVAAAYIGRDWGKYVDVKVLESIVLSPTLGSSCAAIWSLVEAKGGFDHIHFLNELHAKFYLSAAGAVLGSSNLSNNGLQGKGGLIEAAVAMATTDHKADCEKLRNMHNKLVIKAEEQYPTEKKKRERIAWLERVQREASLIKHFPPIGKNLQGNAQGRKLSEFEPSLKKMPIHVVGWSSALKHNKHALQEHLQEVSPEARQHAMDNYTSLSNEGDVKLGDWILQWQSRRDSWTPLEDGIINWLYVDRVLPNTSGNQDEDPFVAHELRPVHQDDVPFKLTSKVKNGIRTLLCSGKFPAIYSVDANADLGFDMKSADRQVPAFIKALKKELTPAPAARPGRPGRS